MNVDKFYNDLENTLEGENVCIKLIKGEFGKPLTPKVHG